MDITATVLEKFGTRLEQTVGTILEERTDQARIRAARAAQDLAEIILEALVDDSLVACRPGCADCCIVNVAVLSPEAASIADYLLGTQPPKKIREVRDRLDDLHEKTRWLDDEERIFQRLHCVFIDDAGKCSIYPVRPLLCRSITSTDADTCRDAIAMQALGEQVTILANITQQKIFEMAFTALGKALDKHGFDSRSVRLAGAVKEELDNRIREAGLNRSIH